MASSSRVMCFTLRAAAAWESARSTRRSADGADGEPALALRRRHHHRVAGPRADERPADGGLERHLAGGRVGLGGGDERVDRLTAAGIVDDGHAAAQPGDLRPRLHLAHLRVERRLAQLEDARLEHRLALLGVVVLGVLLEVAPLAGGPDALGDLAPAVALELRDLDVERLERLRGHDDRLAHRVSAPRLAARRSSAVTSFTRGRPDSSPRRCSCSSIACQPSQSTACGARSRTHSNVGSVTGSGNASAAPSAAISAGEPEAHFLLVPITRLGPRLIQPATYCPGWIVPSSSVMRPPALRIS